MANLLDRLNKATSQRGMKSKLAKVMGVPLANISQWLSGVREPGGETTLKLLHWVEQQERQQNTLGSAINTTKGKATRRKVVHENKPTSSHKQE
jgi:transcriptional regulator with XRE-family HTH domain